MGFLKDAIAVFKKKELSLLDSYKESNDMYTFVFEKEKSLTWEAGQHGLFTISHKKIKNGTKPFTIASAPSENIIKITTRIGDSPSEFKKALLELKQGMKITMSGPVGSFSIKEDSPTILIAGGIGITPFRSILKQIEEDGNGTRKPVHLLYMDSKKSFLFKDEVDQIASKISIDVAYLDSRDELNQEINKLINTYKNEANYLIAGPKSMVESLSSNLKNNHVSKRNIKKDAFFGY